MTPFLSRYLPPNRRARTVGSFVTAYSATLRPTTVQAPSVANSPGKWGQLELKTTTVCDFKRLTAPGPQAQIRPMNKPQSIVPIERIASRIYLIRSEKVMLDSDLAELYGVSTSALNQ